MRVASRVQVAVVAVSAVVLGLLSAAPASAAPEEKVVICHRTNSPTNPYNQVAVAESAAIAGHAAHIGPVFEPGLDQWGDIIPPIRPGLPLGRNWPAGEELLENGCEAEPDVGPLPSADIGDVTCGPGASVEVTVSNDAAATRPAFFAVVVDGGVVERVGPVAPGSSDTVVVDLTGLEDQSVTIAVRSGGEVVASRVATVDCAGPPPSVTVTGSVSCVDGSAQATATLTNDGAEPVEVSATVDGTPVGSPVIVAPGESETATAGLAAYEDRTVTVAVLVDGEVVATYVVTPDCEAPVPAARVSVDGYVCPPPLATVTLANDGDPDSTVVYAIRVDGVLVQESAPIHGGDETTIVADLSAYEDRSVAVTLLADGEVLGQRMLRIDCEGDETGPGSVDDTPTVPTSVPAGLSAVLPGPAAGAALARHDDRPVSR